MRKKYEKKVFGGEEILVRIIDAASLSRHFLRFNYKQLCRDVQTWNLVLSEDDKLKIEPDFNKVKSCLVDALKEFDQYNNANLKSLFSATISWCEDVEYKAMVADKLGVEAKYEKDMSLELSRLDMTREDINMINTTIDQMEPIFKEVSKNNSEASAICKLLYDKLITKLSSAERTLSEIEQHLDRGRPKSSQGEAIYKMVSVLKGNKNKITKQMGLTVGTILFNVFKAEEPKSGWERKVSSAYSTYSQKR